MTHWVVFACNDEGVLGTLNALATQGVSPDNVIGVGLGAYEACKAWAAEQPSGFKAALFISGLDVGASAAQVLYDNVVNGVPLPENTIAPTTIVDRHELRGRLRRDQPGQLLEVRPHTGAGSGLQSGPRTLDRSSVMTA